jgi:hypothetical protein
MLDLYMIRFLISAFFTMILASACIKKSKISDIPQISYIKTINDTISLIPGDSLRFESIMSFSYSIKNGEVGSKDSSSGNLIFEETNKGTSAFSFTVPRFNGFFTKYDAENGVIDVIINKSMLSPTIFTPISAVYWDVKMIDKLGKVSLTIKAGPIWVLQ